MKNLFLLQVISSPTKEMVFVRLKMDMDLIWIVQLELVIWFSIYVIGNLRLILNMVQFWIRQRVFDFEYGEGGGGRRLTAVSGGGIRGVNVKGKMKVFFFSFSLYQTNVNF